MDIREVELRDLLYKAIDPNTDIEEVEKIAAKIRSKTKIKNYKLPVNDILSSISSAIDSNYFSLDRLGVVVGLVVWLGSYSFLFDNKKRIFFILESRFVREKDRIFYSGILYYKLKMFQQAEDSFVRLKGFKEELDNYQTGAMSYRHNPKVEVDKSASPLQLYMYNEAVRGGSVFLISCDCGYFSTYIENLRCAAEDKKGSVFHVNVVFRKKDSLLSAKKKINFILKNVSLPNNIVISIEIMPCEGSVRTYSSISRYVVLAEVMKMHAGSLVLVSDIDLDFSKISISKIISLSASEYAYFRVRGAQVPWFDVMAGFNIFPNNDFSFEFAVAVKNYFVSVFCEGYDGWMLDQVGLSVLLRYFSQSKTKHINGDWIDENVVIVQVVDRPKMRAAARKFGEKLDRLF